jgi:hypothetical protein
MAPQRDDLQNSPQGTTFRETALSVGTRVRRNAVPPPRLKSNVGLMTHHISSLQ